MKKQLNRILTIFKMVLHFSGHTPVATGKCLSHSFFILTQAIRSVDMFRLTVMFTVTNVRLLGDLATAVLKNLKKVFKEQTAPWMVVSFLYYALRFKFIERIPFLSEYLNINAKNDGTDDNQ